MDCLTNKKHIGMLFKEINKGIICALNKEFEAFGITLMQYEVLHYLYGHEGKCEINQKDIEKFFNSTNPTITGILNRLQAKSLISREASTEDARYKVIKLTEEGKKVIYETSKVGPDKMEKRLTKTLTNEEREELRGLLAKVLDGLEE